MINAREKLGASMTSMPMDWVRSAFIDRSRIESGRISDTRQWMLGNGFELLDIPDGQLLTDDGREVLRVAGQAWALRPEIHAQRLTEAMALARQRDNGRPPATCAALIDGQLCGGTLLRAAVCPRCALGKQGVAATLTCDVCGHVTAVMRGES